MDLDGTVKLSKILLEIVHHQKTDLFRNFQNDLLLNIGVMAPETYFFISILYYPYYKAYKCLEGIKIVSL